MKTIKVIMLIVGVIIMTTVIEAKNKNIPENAIWDENDEKWVVYDFKKLTAELYYQSGVKYAEGKILLIDTEEKDKYLIRWNGVWKFWYEGSELGKIEHYNKGVGDGEVIKYHKNGEINYKGFLVNGEAFGKWTYMDKEGSIFREEEYENGEQKSAINYKIIDPEPQRPLNLPKGANFDIKNNVWIYIDKENGYYYGWYINGEKFWKSKLTNGERNGQTTFWYITGNKRREGVMINNEEFGKWNYWKEDGSFNFEAVFDKGKLISRKIANAPEIPKNLPLWSEWDNKTKRWRYFNTDTSIETWYTEDGIKVEEGKLINGIAEGVWIFWWPNGKKKFEGAYKNGLRQGIWKVFKQSGEFEGTVEFKDDKVIKKVLEN